MPKYPPRPTERNLFDGPLPKIRRRSLRETLEAPTLAEVMERWRREAKERSKAGAKPGK